MKRFALFLLLIMLIGASVAFGGCSDKSTLPVTNKEKPKLTIDEIKKKYIDTNIKNIQNFGDNYVLVESQQETLANRFDLYNLSTGDMDTMPKGDEFVTLERIENENYIVLLSSGKHSESPFAKAPYLLKCIRVKNEIDKADDFIALSEDKYLPLDYSIELGCKAETQITDMKVNFNGIEVLFVAVKGKEAELFADDTDIPPTKTYYDKDKNQLAFEINCRGISDKVKAARKATLPDNQYISAYEISQRDDKFYLNLILKDTAKQYLFKIIKLPDGTPYFQVSFISES